MAYKADKVQLEPKVRKPYGATFFNVTNILFHHHFVFHFLFLRSSLTFLHRECGREKEQRDLEIDLQDLLDSVDHQQRREDAYIKEMKSRGGRASRCRQL